MEQDNVNHPSHYNIGGRKECWEEMIEKFGIFYTAVFDVMNAYKYFYRAGMKEGNTKEQDLQKMHKYIDHATKIINERGYVEKITEHDRDCVVSLLYVMLEEIEAGFVEPKSGNDATNHFSQVGKMVKKGE